MNQFVVGTGLLCLDVVYPPGEETPLLYAGGSSLNIATILSDWGWSASLIGRIGDDQAGRYLLKDLSAFNVNTSGIIQDPCIDTPIYSQTFDESGHVFQRKCLQCGAPSPTVAPLSLEVMQQRIETLPGEITAAVIERDDPASVLLARECRERGALVYVELNRMSSETQCLELIDQAHVYKYARDRCGLLPPQDMTPGVPIEIETQGKDGLRYRLSNGEWRQITAPQVDLFIDAAGSGDWVSATVLNQIGSTKQMPDLENIDLDKILAQAQSEAAENGKYIGARGRLYHHRPTIQACDACPACGA